MDQLANEFFAGVLGKRAARDLKGEIREEDKGNAARKARGWAEKPGPLRPIENDPTAFIKRYEQSREDEANAERIKRHEAVCERLERREALRRRRILRREEKLLGYIERVAASQGLKVPDDLAVSVQDVADDLGDSVQDITGGPKIRSWPIRLASALRRSTNARQSWAIRHLKRLDRWAAIIEHLEGGALRASLRLMLRSLAAQIRPRIDDVRPPLALEALPPAPILTAGGKTARFVPLD